MSYLESLKHSSLNIPAFTYITNFDSELPSDRSSYSNSRKLFYQYELMLLIWLEMLSSLNASFSVIN